MKHTLPWRILCRQAVMFATMVLAAGVQGAGDSPVVLPPLAALAAPTPPAEALGAEQRNEESGYSFRPVASFALETAGGWVQMTAPDADPDVGPILRLYAGPWERTQSLAEVFSSTVTNLKESGVSISKPRDFTIDHAPGLVADLSMTGDAKPWIGRVVVAMPDTHSGFYMIGAAPPERWPSEVAGLFEAVLASVKFFAPAAMETPAMATEVVQIAAPAVATPRPASETWTRPADGMVMVAVPPGAFTMGSTDAEIEAALAGCNRDYGNCSRDWFAAEAPQHTVTLDAFWIDATEVTNRQFERFAQATDYHTDAETGGGVVCNANGDCRLVSGADWRHPEGPGCNIADRMEHPVVQVSWNDAAAYCEWAGARLPTEAEWEKAARGMDSRIYPWGNDFDGGKANLCDTNCEFLARDANADDGDGRTAPVGSHAAGLSPYRALDLAGNVWEWVADWYGTDYYGRSPQQNPTGPQSGEGRALRGGSWRVGRDFARGVHRSWGYADGRDLDVGFRCSMSSTSSGDAPSSIQPEITYTALPSKTSLPAQYTPQPDSTPAAQLPAAPASCPEPRVQITSPANGAAISGNVPFIGTAAIDNLTYYKFEYRPVGTPDWLYVTQVDNQPVIDGKLMDFVTSTIPPGVHDFRLVAVVVTGNYKTCEIQLTVAP